MRKGWAARSGQPKRMRWASRRTTVGGELGGRRWSSGEVVRARFAPSPTGALHLGGARTAVFNYLLVRGAALRGAEAALVLRIEDTDASRSSAASEASIVADLAWLGLSWEEGPGASQSGGPYRCSERGEVYAAALERLVASGRAYRDFSEKGATRIERDAWRDAPAEAEGLARSGAPHVIRFKAPRTRAPYRVRDAIRGWLEWRDASASVGSDFALTRRDGRPLYNLCCAVDDAAMGITHVVRGEDHVANTLKQALLLEALDAPRPTYAHCALVVDAQRKKLSKRRGAAASSDDDDAPTPFAGATVADARRDGATPLALGVYLAGLGFDARADDLPPCLDEVAARFDLAKVGAAPAAYDPAKLKWLDARYFARLDRADRADALARRLALLGRPVSNATDPTAIRFLDLVAADLVGDDLVPCADLAARVVAALRFDPADVASHLDGLSPDRRDALAQLVNTFASAFAEQSTSLAHPDAWHDVIHAVMANDAAGGRAGVKRGTVFLAARLALTGAAHGFDLPRHAALLDLAADLFPDVPPPRLRARQIADQLLGPFLLRSRA